MPGSEMMAKLENSMRDLAAEKARGKAEKGMTKNKDKRGNGVNRTMAPKYKNEGKSLALLQVNCRSIYSKALEFWNLVDTYNPGIITGTESWLREKIGNAENFRADFTIFRRDRNSRGGGVFMCVKNNTACSELWVDDEFEILAVTIKGSDPKYGWEIVGIYRAPNEDIRVIEKLAARTGYSMKQSIIGGDLNLPKAVWKGVADGTSSTQDYIHRLVWDNGYTQVVEKPTHGDSLLDGYLVRPESALISCDTVQGISDHCGVLLGTEWVEKGLVTQEKRIIPAYPRTNVVWLHFLRDNFTLWANIGSCVEDIWRNFKDIVFAGIEHFVPHKTLHGPRSLEGTTFRNACCKGG
jgi:hypothetical protein